MSGRESLGDWIDNIGLNLLDVESLEGEEDFTLDFTGASLEKLEQALLSHFGEPLDLDDPEREDLANGAAGYLGEVLMRLAGGSWGWRGGEPFARADKAIGLPPAYPLRLLAQAVESQSERVFSDVYAAWAEAVARHRATNPQWAAKKKPTPGVDPFEMDPKDAAYIAAWTAERREAFPRWESTYGTGTTWDFGPESLDGLENILLRIATTPEDLHDPARRGFVEGAVWYLGEVIRRIRGGTWEYRTQDPENPNIYAGDPYVHPTGRDSELVMPIVLLGCSVEDRVPGTLRADYARCANERPGGS